MKTEDEILAKLGDLGFAIAVKIGNPPSVKNDEEILKLSAMILALNWVLGNE